MRWFERAEPALQALAQGAPALAILDVGLPDINGFELCRRLLAQAADLPILFLTARSDEVDRLIGLEIGADDCRQAVLPSRRSARGCAPFCVACTSSSACSSAPLPFRRFRARRRRGHHLLPSAPLPDPLRIPAAEDAAVGARTGVLAAATDGKRLGAGGRKPGSHRRYPHQNAARQAACG